MSVDLDKPLVAADADPQFLADLQGNILKGHGRNHTVNLFVKFDPAHKDEAKTFVRGVAEKVTSSKKQFEDTKIFKATHKSGDTFVAFFLTAAGYRALGIEAAKIPADPSFQSGLKNQTALLNDPPAADWEGHFQQEIHALIIIADNNLEKLGEMYERILDLKPASVTFSGVETGLAMRNENRDGIEHFGYVDGRSQPLLLQEDIDRETDETDGTNVWNPAFPLKQALVPCSGGTAGISFGSYFVFRKLEQNVSGFKAKEKAVAHQLKLKKVDSELAGAMIVGRFEDGTPVVLQKLDGAHNPVPNNFNYESDPKGVKCPFHAHIRKSNPRGESVGIIAPNVPTLEQERSHIMARRGITYGTRIWENNMPNTKLDEDHLPSEGVGLLFMAYQSDIANQFEFTQSTWVNNEGFVKFDKTTGQPMTGLDPVIGQGTPTIPLRQTKKWGKDLKQDVEFHGFVKLKGGEYFYAPCISFLKSV